jgi:ribosome-binding protein aMBF1 (putative translation factor)
MKQDSWRSSDADILKTHREAAGLERWQLASLAAVSVNQIQQLEEGGMRSFYSPAIKAAVGRKVLGKLGVELAPPAPASHADDESRSHQPTMLQEMPKAPRPGWSLLLALLGR